MNASQGSVDDRFARLRIVSTHSLQDFRGGAGFNRMGHTRNVSSRYVANTYRDDDGNSQTTIEGWGSTALACQIGQIEQIMTRTMAYLGSLR
jgi:hypothetical protein